VAVAKAGGISLENYLKGSSIADSRSQSVSLLSTGNRRRWRQGGIGVTRMGLTESGPTVAIVGVTGAVGQEFLSVLTDRNFPYSNLKLLASKRSAGKHITFEVSTDRLELHPRIFCGFS
jgi:hypothetical protein